MKLRELFYRYPWLGELRFRVLTWFCVNSLALYDNNYRRLRLLSPKAKLVIDNQTPVIYALYHGCMISLLDMHPRKKVTILISNSRDGEMVARFCLGWGFSIARGSPKEGAVRGTFAMVEAAQAGQSLAMMVDGPKGPRGEVKPGVIKLAQLTGLPIIPIGYSGRSAFKPNSWDRFDATSWASPMLTVYGDPLVLTKGLSDEEVEQKRLELQESLKQVQQIAESSWAASDAKRAPGFVG